MPTNDGDEMTQAMLIAKNAAHELHLLPRLANRHGLITGATGTGKTVTLQKMAESFANIGVPVFVADIKGDLSGIAAAGTASPKLLQRLAAIGITDYAPRANTTVFWDVYGEKGHPVRATISDMGPYLLARLLNLNDTQTGVMQLVFRIADDNGMLLLDLKDLRAMVQYVGENAKNFTTEYGNISAASIGAIQRNLLGLEEQGGDVFFGEPMLDIADLMQCDAEGRGVINVLAAEKLYHSPKLYSTFLLWLLSELFEQLPEVGDPEKPRLAFFFDEAHLLFDRAPRALVEKIEQVARLVRSKGVSVWFITQNPADLPDSVLGQLGNRVQHALRAFTAKDQRALRMAAENYRANPAFDTADAIQHVGTGEAVTSFLGAKGAPGVAERTLIRPPLSQLGPIPDAERARVMQLSPLGLKYDATVDRDSAHEMLARRTEAVARAAAEAEAEAGDADAPGEDGGSRGRRYQPGNGAARKPAARRGDSMLEAFGKSMARQLGTRTGQMLVRGILGSLSGRR